jgi:hypothetical protein
MTITLRQVTEQATLLTLGKTPSVKFALQIAGCSAQQSLSGNGRMARVLAKYVHSPLPEQYELIEEFKREKVGILPNHIAAVYWAEYLENEGLLDDITNSLLSGSLGNNYREQLHVRSYIYDLYHPTVDDNGKTKGYGMGYKTISFAMLLLLPLSCELAVLDRHHLARMTKTVQTVGYGPTYLKIEREMIAERDAQSTSSTVSLGVYGWLRWEQWRQWVGASEATFGTVESHENLNCRQY